jgi:hypothetical protein
MATTVAGDPGHFRSDGKAVDVSLLYTVAKNAVVYVEGWLGIAGDDGTSGGTIALQADNREYNFQVPAGLTVAKGDTVYITIATVTGHYPDDEAYTLTGTDNNWAFFKATRAKDANNIVSGVMINCGAWWG